MSVPPVGCDSSLLVASFLADHPRRGPAKAAVQERVTALPTHTLFETYSVLTRLPPADRVPGDVIVEAVRRLNKASLALPAREQLKFWEALPDLGITGGATYDALIAATVKHHGGLLISADRRAVRTYRAIGVDYELLDP